MSETNPTPEPKKRRHWGKVVLFVSLAFNLLIMGLVAGALLGGPRDRDRNPVLRDLGYGPFVHALPRADRAAMTQALKREAGSFRENRAELRRQFEAFLTAVRNEPFDAEYAKRLISEQQGRIGERQRLGQQLLLERLAAMSSGERAAYADKLDNLLRRRKH